MNEDEYHQQPMVLRYALGHDAIHRASDDPENALLVALTERKLCLLILALMVTTRLFPELSEMIDETVVQLDEVGGAQRRFGLDGDSTP